MKHKYLYITAFFTTALFTSCSDYLDELPDNRTELTTEESITKILVSAYPTTTSCEIGELHSDNIDENSNLYTYLFRLNEHMYHWQQTTEEGQDSPHALWIAITLFRQQIRRCMLLSGWEIRKPCNRRKEKPCFVVHTVIFCLRQFSVRRILLPMPIKIWAFRIWTSWKLR